MNERRDEEPVAPAKKDHPETSRPNNKRFGRPQKEVGLRDAPERLNTARPQSQVQRRDTPPSSDDDH